MKREAIKYIRGLKDTLFYIIIKSEGEISELLFGPRVWCGVVL